MDESVKVVVRWRRDDVPDGELTWGELMQQLPMLAKGAEIVLAGYCYEHEDGTTVELAGEDR